MCFSVSWPALYQAYYHRYRFQFLAEPLQAVNGRIRGTVSKIKSKSPFIFEAGENRLRSSLKIPTDLKAAGRPFFSIFSKATQLPSSARRRSLKYGIFMNF